jgi:hypothetical protein
MLRTPELVPMGFRWASEAARKGTGTFSRGLGRRWVEIFAGGIGGGGGKMSQSPGLWRLGTNGFVWGRGVLGWSFRR